MDQLEENGQLIYEYTEGVFHSSCANTGSLDTRLGTCVGFGGVLLRLAVDLPQTGTLERGLKLAVCGWAVLAVGCALAGFLSWATGQILKPETLLQKWYHESEELCRLAIVRSWRDAIEDMLWLRRRKSRWLNAAVVCLALAALTLGAVGIVTTIG